MIYKIFIGLLTVFITINAAYAVDYTINNIKVDVEGESAIDARNKALIDARRNAFNILSKRLTSDGQQSSMPSVSDDQIAAMVNSFEINREKLSKNRYLASVNVAFNERAVQGYIGRYTNMAMPDQNLAYPTTPSGSISTQDTIGATGNTQIQHSNLYRQYLQQQNQQHAMSANMIPYKMQVDLNDIRNWVSVQRSLEAIGNVRINSLNTRRAIVTLFYTGDASQLQQNLNMKGMQLYSNNPNAAQNVPYILMSRG